MLSRGLGWLGLGGAWQQSQNHNAGGTNTPEPMESTPFYSVFFFLGGGLDLVDLFPALGSASVVGAFARCVAPDPNSWDSLTSTTGLRPGHWDEVLVILRIQVHSTLLSISRVLSCTVCCVLSYVFWQHLAKGLHMEFWESIGRSWVSEGKLCSLKHLAGGLGYAATGTS